MINILILLIIIALIIEFSRNKWDIYGNLFNNYFFSVLRKVEYDGHLTGATWLLFGCLSAIYLFSIKIAVVALLILTIGDALAAVIGKTFPLLRIGNKSLFGTLVAIFVTFSFIVSLDIGLGWEIILLGTIFGMLIELIPSYINDNITIPIASGLAMTVGLKIL